MHSLQRTAIGWLALGALGLGLACTDGPQTAVPSSNGGAGGSHVIEAGASDVVVAADGASFPRDLPKIPEMDWLTKIGWGKAQTDRVCARGNQDPVALALCAFPPITGFDDMLRAFWPAGRKLDENYTYGVTF